MGKTRPSRRIQKEPSLMNIEDIQAYCRSKKGVTEEFPFDNDTLVFKVKNKMFLLVGLENHPISINVKCDPEIAIELRENSRFVNPGYHMNKKHWNTIILDNSLSNEFLKEQISNSYDLVVKSLSKKLKEELNG